MITPSKPSHPMYDIGVKPKSPTPPKEPVALPSIEKMEALIRAGCADVVQQLIEQHNLSLKIDGVKLVSSLKGTELYLDKFITSISSLKDTVRKLANVDDAVLITGETGTGKEIIARAMIGDRGGSVVVANCAGLPENLIESELFGHVRGAFTGAESQKQGLFAVARDGVMFLDEIGELPLSVQAKLLRAIQENKIRKVGSNQEEEIHCKFVCATHRDLKKMVSSGQFREDLYARISTFEVHIPPLRERIDDAKEILLSLKGGKEFLEELTKQNRRIDDIDLSLNVRALQRCVRRFNVLGNVILS